MVTWFLSYGLFNKLFCNVGGNRVEKLLRLENITKRFTGTLALHNVDFDLNEGEVHAIIGENGAGKSTLIKIITGYHQPNTGKIFVEDKEVIFNDTRSSYKCGIAAIYQEASLFQDLTIAENIYMGHQEVNPVTKSIRWRKIYNDASALIKSLDVDLNPRALVKSLGFAEKQLVEIIKALSMNAKILIMDEPTSALTSEEVDYLFSITKKLREQGTGIIFISHKIDEVMEIADRVTVLRDGKIIGTDKKENLNRDRLISMMVGRNLDNFFPRTRTKAGKTLLEVKNLFRAGEFKDISFSLKEGEIVGLAGLVGAGRTELGRTIFGVNKPEGGQIFVDGKQVNIDNPKIALALGIAYLSESRGEYGLILQMDITKNITLPILDKVTHFGCLNKTKERKIAEEYYNILDIRSYGLDQMVGSLSGGNQQKVSIAKWLAANARILILDEPTRGVDVGTKEAVHNLMNNLTKEGIAILMISSELPEIIGMSDRILVMNTGILTKELDRSEASQEGILKAAIITK